MTTEPTRSRPWRRIRPRLHRPDVVAAPEATPLAELHIYPDMVLLTRRGPRGAWRSYPVSPDALTQALSRLPATTGLLPPATLGAGRIDGEPFFVVWSAAGVAALQTEQHRYTIPLPPLVWAGCGRDYRIYALAAPELPTTDLQLYVPPFPNTYEDGGICWGTVAERRPATTGAALLSMRRLFLEESAFNTHIAGGKSHAFPTSVLARWQELEQAGAESYPLDDLVPTRRRLSWLLGGGPWQH